MPTRSNDQLLLDVFVQLTQYWEAEFPPEEIGSDVEKIHLMRSVSEALKNTPVVIPEPVLQLYAKVFLRDVWTS